MLFLGNLGSAGLVQPQDPLFMISVRTLFWIVGAIALGMALVCLFGKGVWLKLILILWLATNFCVYQIGFLQRGNYRGPGAYLASPASTFGISSNTAWLIVITVSIYLLSGSLMALLWLWREDSKGYLKTACAHCGGHITFLPNALGQQISCPHCRAAITLSKPDENLKMICVLCGGHVEFPTHALGQKIPCPHCRSTITLLKQLSRSFETTLKEEKAIL
jgi:DNA-directed RNA polymerase subunit RPC12/RpoP